MFFLFEIESALKKHCIKKRLSYIKLATVLKDFRQAEIIRPFPFDFMQNSSSLLVVLA